jgi:Protein of unknown function (DUF3352)
MVRIRLSIPVLAVIAALAFAGCGSDSSSGSGESSSSSALAELASPGSLVFAEGELKPTGELKTNVEAVSKRLTGSSLGEFVASELESSARKEGESFDYATEVEPWLGKKGGVVFERLIEGELSEPLIAVQTTDPKAAQAFIDKRTRESSDPSKDASYAGVEFKVGGPEKNAVGLIDETLVLAQSEKEFKAAVDASQGDSLGGEDRFQKAIAAASNGSFADVYVDVGGIIKQSEDEIDTPTKEVLQSAGIDPSEATAVASVIPRSDQIQVDLSSDLGGEKASAGDSSKLLGSLPASSFAALSFTEFNEQLEEALDSLDESGIPPDLDSGELKSTLSQAGIDLDKLAASLEEGAVFAEGSNRSSLGGAMVVTSNSGEAADAIASLGTLLRGANVPGITAVGGKASGFSVSNGAAETKPIVVIAKGDRIAVGYGLAPALAGLNAGSGATLSGKPGYKAAVSALGKTPISAFVDGPAALDLAEALVPRSKSDFWEAVPYLKKISYIGLGSGTNGELATAKLIAGLGK